MSPTSKSRKRKRRAQLLADRYVPVGGGPRWSRIDDRTWAQKFDHWMLSLLSARMAAALFVLACGILSLLAVGTVHVIDDLHAYENAPTCDVSPNTACREELQVVISAVGATSGKDRTYYVVVSGLLQTTIDLRDGSGVWDVAHDGDDAVVELWHGVPVSITADHWTSQTTDTPRKTAVQWESSALVALAGAAMFALYWLRRLAFQRTGGEHWPEWLTLLEPTALIATIGAFIGAVFGSIVQSFVVTVVVGGWVTLFFGALFTVNSWRARTRST